MGGIKKEEKEIVGSSPTMTKKKVVSTGSTTAIKSTATKAKKPVAGIDENGTFRAWDNAKAWQNQKKPRPRKAA